MNIKNLIDEDFANYKLCSMFIGFPSCTFKCEKECGICMCQNSDLVNYPTITIDYKAIVKRYINNHMSHAIVFGGLEPFDSYKDMIDLISEFRRQTQDDIVIYTGYKEEELYNELLYLSSFSNIIIKFGRFVPYQEKHYDEVLGVNLASANQYAVRLS